MEFITNLKVSGKIEVIFFHIYHMFSSADCIHAFYQLKFTPKSKFIGTYGWNVKESVPSAEETEVKIRFRENQILIDFYMLIWFLCTNRFYFSCHPKEKSKCTLSNILEIIHQNL